MSYDDVYICIFRYMADSMSPGSANTNLSSYPSGASTPSPDDDDASGVISVNDEVRFDANEVLGFWCVPCPEGADCEEPGNDIATVGAEEGYFMGLDETGTLFVPCLSDIACDADGYNSFSLSLSPSFFLSFSLSLPRALSLLHTHTLTHTLTHCVCIYIYMFVLSSVFMILSARQMFSLQ